MPRDAPSTRSTANSFFRSLLIMEKEIAMMISDSPQMTAISTPIAEDTPDRLSDTEEIMLFERIALMPRTCRLISAVTSSIS